MTAKRPSSTLAELVLERPSAVRVLARLGLDYCCGGGRTLDEACCERGLDPVTVAVLLAHEQDPVPVETTDWAAAPLPELCRHIVSEHHARLRWDLPRLAELAERTAWRHGAARPDLHELRAELDALRAELEGHIDNEERELFPLLVDGGPLDARVLDPLVHEHDTIGTRLRRLRRLGGDYETAGALCNTHRALLQGLHGLELDLHQHVHEENNVLFPRALAQRRDEICFTLSI